MYWSKTLLLSLLGCWGCVSGQGENDVKLEDVEFYLYTRNTMGQQQRLWPNDSCSVINSDYRCDRPTKLIIYGHPPSCCRDPIPNIRRAFLSRGEEYNVITVDCILVFNSDISAESIKQMKRVAQYLAQMIDLLVEELGSNSTNIALVGQSEGALVASLAAKNSKNKVGRVVALDPINQNIIERKINALLPDDLMLNASKSDAHLVEIVYTFNGVPEQLGHASYYVNGGETVQPGCEDIAIRAEKAECSSFLASKFFAEAIEDPKAFVARMCDDYDSFKTGKCSIDQFGSFPNALTEKNDEGKYYLRTGSESPYGLGEDGAWPASL